MWSDTFGRVKEVKEDRAIQILQTQERKAAGCGCYMEFSKRATAALRMSKAEAEIRR